ncbi:MAG: hypothetical protein V1744_06620 [Candidatus Altiarchaeota archaeon]
MSLTDLVDVTQYARKYGLKREVIGLAKIIPPTIDLNLPGLIMHGSEADPYNILKYGLVPQQTDDNKIDREWQVCLGLNSKNQNITILKGLSRKNSAVKYSGYFSKKGIIYVIDDAVKKLPAYREFWDQGNEGRGYAWITQPIPPNMIKALITENVPLAAAAATATKTDKPILKPDGTCYQIKPLD